MAKRIISHESGANYEPIERIYLFNKSSSIESMISLRTFDALHCVIFDRKFSTSSLKAQGLEIFGGYPLNCNITGSRPAESRQTGLFPSPVYMYASAFLGSRTPAGSTSRRKTLCYPEGEPTFAAASRTAIIIFGLYAPHCSMNTPPSALFHADREGYRAPGWGRNV